MRLKLATRISRLAQIQAQIVAQDLKLREPSLEVDIIGHKTQGDRLIDQSLALLGGKGLFIREIEEKLLSGEADLAVHSLKDMPVDIHPDLPIVAVSNREDPSDAFISGSYDCLMTMPQHSILGTSSLRRSLIASRMRPDIQLRPVRGNVETRLRKLDQGQFDALILATSGLVRLNLESRIKKYLDTEKFVPAAGQGVIAIQTHKDNETAKKHTLALNNPLQHRLSTAERLVLKELNGGCHLPVGIFAQTHSNQVSITCMVGTPDHEKLICSKQSGHINQLEELTSLLINDLLKKGALEIIESVKNALEH